MKEDQESTQFRIVLKWIGFSILLFFLLTSLLTLLIQIPLVQNWVVKDVSARISRDLKTEVKVGHIKLNFFNDLLLEDLLLRDQQGDTLLYSKRAYFDLDQPLWGLLKGVMSFQSIDLQESQCYLKTYGDQSNNYSFLLDYLIGEAGLTSINDTINPSFSVVFDPLRVALNDIVFHDENLFRGRNSTLILPYATARIFKTSNSDPLQFTDISLDKPRFILEKYPVEISDSTDLKEVLTGIIEEMKPVKKTGLGSVVIVDRLQINEGNLQLINKFKPIQRMAANVIDWRDAQANHIDLVIENFAWHQQKGTLTLSHLDFTTPEGFEVEGMASSDIEIDSDKISFSDFILQTPNSRLSDQIQLSYSSLKDFEEFEDKIEITAGFASSYIALKDILYFSNNLNHNEFFNLNGGKRIELDGELSGTLNNLRGRNIDLKLADQGFLRGNFTLKNSTVKGAELLNLDLDRAEIELRTLRQLIPNFNPPITFDKLGLLRFSGNFAGFFHDFIASGSMLTDLGELEMDMRMKWSEGGFNKAAYQGKLQLIDFDLSSWTGSDLYGMTSLTAEVKDGQGLSGDEASADLYARLEDFYFKGYNYRNAVLQGHLNKQFFEGQFYISDPNVTLDFNGHIDITDSLPKFDFTASVEYLNFQALNLSRKKLEASGDIGFDFTYHDLFNLNGTIDAHNLRVIDDTITHYLDSLTISSTLNDRFNKNLRVISDIFDFHLIGNFDLRHLPSSIKMLVQQKHPQLAQKFNLDAIVPDSLYAVQDFHFNGVMEDSKGIQKLFNASLADFQHVVLNGSFASDSLLNFKYRMDLHAPYLQLGENQFYSIALDLKGENSNSEWDVYSERAFMGRKELFPLSFHGELTSDSLDFALTSQSFANIFTDVDLQGLLYLNDTLFQVDLANSSFRLLDEPWQVVPNNFIQLGDHFIKTENMVFLSNESYIRVSSPGDNSLNLEIEKIDISFIDGLLGKDQLSFDGYAYSTLRFEDIFSKSPLSLDFTIDSFRVNDDDYGTVSVTAGMPDFDTDGFLKFSISDGLQEFSGEGPFYFPVKEVVNGRQLTYDLDCKLREYPLTIGEYFLTPAISNTAGTINGDFRFYQEEQRPSISGDVVLNGSTKINYLGTTYRMENQKASLNSEIFDLSSTIVIDELGNSAEITGGIVHNHFKKFGLDATIASTNFQFLNTTRQDNNIYYGNGIGSGTIQFTGNFQQTNIRIQARTGPGSNLFIPIEEDFSSDGDAFITYLFDQDSTAEQLGNVNLTGVNLDMKLQVTPDAEMQIIFDELSGDIIRGTGNGNLILTKERASNLQMTGRYVIEEGQYLYTLFDFINKPFAIDRGGLITWSGDPLNADLNIQARYTGLRIPPRNLIAEFLE